jgi:3-methylcrotonyl-CoA carboxylase alpha subunit
MAGRSLRLSLGEESRDVRVQGGEAFLAGRRIPFQVSRNGERLEAIRIGDRAFPVRIAREGDRALVWCAGRTLEFRKAGRRPGRARDAGGSLAAPMPGRVRRILAGPGSRVAAGDVVVILEAMKMEHAIRAPGAGTVTKVFHSEGDLVDAGTLLAEIQ